MRTVASAPNKGNEDVKGGAIAHPGGTGHQVKLAAKKCKHSRSFVVLIVFLLLISGMGLKVPGKCRCCFLSEEEESPLP